MMSGPMRSPAIEGWFTMDDREPHLVGLCCAACGTYMFPPLAASCRNPDCQSMELERVLLSRTGRIWSYTNACYRPPEPYVSPNPFEPFVLAAVELECEKMIVLGQVARGVGIEHLRVGMRMELALETLHADEESHKIVWNWKPLEETC